MKRKNRCIVVGRSSARCKSEMKTGSINGSIDCVTANAGGGLTRRKVISKT